MVGGAKVNVFDERPPMLATLAVALLQVPPVQLFGFDAPEVAVTADTITVALTHDGQTAIPTHAVPFTVEPYTLNLSGAESADEANLFGSGLAFDLDGDGATTAKIKLWCMGTTGVFGWGGRAQPLGQEVWTYAPEKVVRVGQKGAYAMLYTPCGRNSVVGLSPADRPIVIESLPGPVLQIQVLEIVPSSSAKSSFELGEVTVGGKPAKVVRIEAMLFEPLRSAKPEWAHIRGVFVALPRGARTHQVRLGFTGKGPAMITSAVNVAPGANQRQRGRFGFAELK